MDETETKRRGPLLWLAGRSRRFWIVARLGCIIPLLYLLSLPLMVCIDSNFSPPPVGSFRGNCRVLYVRPLGFVYANSPPNIRDWIDWYVTVLV